MLWMFPIIGRPNQETWKVKLNGNEYSLGSHGISRVLPWAIAEQSSKEIKLVQSYLGELVKNNRKGEKPDELNFIPFNLIQTIGIKESSLYVNLDVVNSSPEILKYDIVFHPASKIIEGKTRSQLMFDGKKIPLEEVLNTILKDGTQYIQDTNVISYFNEKGYFSMKTDGFKHLMLWTPHKKAGMFCIEPITNLPEENKNKYLDDYVCETLSPGGRAEYSIYLSFSD